MNYFLKGAMPCLQNLLLQTTKILNVELNSTKESWLISDFNLMKMFKLETSTK